MLNYTYSYKPLKFNSFIDLIFDDLLETPVDNDIAAQEEQTVANETAEG